MRHHVAAVRPGACPGRPGGRGSTRTAAARPPAEAEDGLIMTRWVCGACGSLWNAGAPCCPSCRSTDHDEEGATVPNATTGGPSYEPGREPDGYTAPSEPDAAGQAPAGTGVPPGDSGASEGVSGPQPDPPPVKAPKADWVEHAAAVGIPAAEAEQMTKADLVETVKETIGGGQPSAGTSSSTSASKPGKSSTTTPSGPPSPAPTTESPSSTPPPPETPAESSFSAGSTDGSTPATGSGQSDSES